MADLYEYKTDTGVIVPDTADIKAGVESEYKAALGDDLDTSPATPQGRLIAAETDARAAVLRFCALMANQINPDIASGTFLDAVAALSGIERIKAYGTTVSATLGGVPGSVIPAGSQAKTEAGDIFYLENAATIGGGGTVSANFISQETGPVPCPSGSLEQIVSPVSGWETITNAAAGTLGADMESDADLRARRKASLYQGSGYINSMYRALYYVPNLKSAYIYENKTANSETTDGITIPGHSLYVVADGGTDADVAQAIFNTKSAGCGLSGTTTATAYDDDGRTYSILFNRPIQVQIDVAVQAQNLSTLSPQTVAQQIKDAVLAFASDSIPGVDGAKIGQDISPFEIAGAINITVDGVFVKSVGICLHGETPATSVIDIKLNEVATIAAADITVTVA